MGSGASYYSIGEVSKITGLHVKSLRYYDRIGVFRADYVDARSGYRYYSFDQIQKIIAVRICLDAGIVLSDLEKYRSDGTTDYTGLIADAGRSIEEQIRTLENRKVYLDFLGTEVSFNNGDDPLGNNDECYGSLPLWAVPYEGDMEDFSRKEMFLRLADDARSHGYQIMPLYFGMLMKCSGKDRKIYSITGIEDFLKVGETDDEHIIRTPEAWYRRVERPDLDVTVADSVFPELFELDYDKYVLTTISLQSNHAEPVYSMFINLPGNGKGNQRPFVI